MAYLGNAPAQSFISFERQVFTIVNSQTAYTLSHSVTNENDIRLVVNNVVQEPGSGKAYTASGTTLTLSAALTNGTDEMYCVFLGRAVGTVNAPAGSVGTSQLAADAVTNAKIADDAVESEQLNNNVISGQTELSSEPADTDEFLISDAGTLKRIDYSHIKGGGITEADQWRLTSSITSDTDPISANLERVDDATFSKIGTGMSVVNGHWIFPSTGLWQVFGNANIETAAVDNVYLKIEASTDGGSSYDSLVQFQQSDSVATYGGHAGGHVFVNVTNTSTYRVKFLCGSLGGSGAGINGNTNFNFTYFTFIRLGDSQ